MKNDLSKRLDKMEKSLRKINNQKSVPLEDLLTDSFMRENTKFLDADSFFEASGFDTSSQEAFNSIPDDEINKFTSENSNFSSWNELLGAAGKKYVAKQMGF